MQHQNQTKYYNYFWTFSTWCYLYQLQTYIEIVNHCFFENNSILIIFFKYPQQKNNKNYHVHITMQAFCRPFVLQSVSYCVCSLKTLEQLMCVEAHRKSFFPQKWVTLVSGTYWKLWLIKSCNEELWQSKYPSL